MTNLYTDAYETLMKEGIVQFALNSYSFAKAAFHDKAVRTVHRDRIENDRAVRAVSNSYWTYGDSATVNVDRPQETSVFPEEFARYVGNYDLPEPHVYTIADARITDDAAIGFTTDNRVLLDSVRGRTHKFCQAIRDTGWRQKLEYRRLTAANVVGSHDCLFHMVMPVTSYYLWIHEYLPKLYGLEVFQDRTGKCPGILIAPDSPDWVYESFEVLGFDTDRLVEYDEWPIRVDELVLARHRYNDISRGGYAPPTPSEWEWLRGRATDIPAPDQFPDRVYVSRSDAPRRAVVNEDEVVAKLEALGFESYALSELPFEEQVALFVGADVVVGVHGAGLVNCVFGDTPSIVELLPDAYPRATYYCLAAALGSPYVCQLCETVTTENRPRERDVEIDTDLLNDVIDQMID